jgi:hypothetical protein
MALFVSPSYGRHRVPMRRALPPWDKLLHLWVRAGRISRGAASCSIIAPTDAAMPGREADPKSEVSFERRVEPQT